MHILLFVVLCFFFFFMLPNSFSHCLQLLSFCCLASFIWLFPHNNKHQQHTWNIRRFSGVSTLTSLSIRVTSPAATLHIWGTASCKVDISIFQSQWKEQSHTNINEPSQRCRLLWTLQTPYKLGSWPWGDPREKTPRLHVPIFLFLLLQKIGLLQLWDSNILWIYC